MDPTTHSTWTFLSNHAHVLICLDQQPDARLRDLAARVGLTERAVQSIVRDLERAGVVTRIREGRRNRYRIHEAQLRRPLGTDVTTRDLLALIRPEPAPR